MARKLVGRGQYTLAHLHDGKSMQMSIDLNLSSIQLFSRQKVAFSPDFAVTPLVLTPELYMSGSKENKIGSAYNPVWTINGKKPIEFGGVTSASAPFALTINKNLVSAPQLNIEFTCSIKDPDTQLGCQVSARACIFKQEIDNFTPQIILNTPDGITFRNEIRDTLTAVCKLYRGTSLITQDVQYKWYYQTGGEYVLLEDSVMLYGQGTDTITVYRSSFKNTLTLKCEVIYENATYIEYVVFNKREEQYILKIENKNGDKLKNGQGFIFCEAHVYRGAEMIPDAKAEQMFNFCWKKYNRNTGQVDPNWRNPVARKIELTKDDVTRLSVFTCELEHSGKTFPYTYPITLE